MAQNLYYTQLKNDFDDFRRNFNRLFKIQLNGKFVGLSGLISRTSFHVYAMFVRAFNRALAVASSILNRKGFQVFSVCGYKLKVNNF